MSPRANGAGYVPGETPVADMTDRQVIDEMLAYRQQGSDIVMTCWTLGMSVGADYGARQIAGQERWQKLLARETALVWRSSTHLGGPR